jgi:hypothetical protein
MKINIEIDMTPAEFRQAMGLPDVTGVQDDMAKYVRERMAQGAEGFDPATLLRDSGKAWQGLMERAFNRMAEQYTGTEDEEAASPAGQKKSRQRPSSGQKANRSTDEDG